MPAFLFDFTLAAAVTIDAATVDEARRRLTESLDSADAAVSIDGQPVVMEVSLDSALELGMIDGQEAGDVRPRGVKGR
jgi:hypothetical protein